MMLRKTVRYYVTPLLFGALAGAGMTAVDAGAHGVIEGCITADRVITVTTPGQVEVQEGPEGEWVPIASTFAVNGWTGVRIGDADRPVWAFPHCPRTTTTLPTTTTAPPTTVATSTTIGTGISQSTTTTVVVHESPAADHETPAPYDVGEHAPSVGPNPSTLTAAATLPHTL